MNEIITVSSQRLDRAAGQTLVAAAAGAWARGKTTVTIDLEAATELDSFGLSALVSVHRGTPEGARVVLCGLSAAMRDALEVTGLYRLFEIYESETAVEYALTA
jgi:anti-anti-sigma factor